MRKLVVKAIQKLTAFNEGWDANSLAAIWFMLGFMVAMLLAKAILEIYRP